ncbi:MAG: T9SS type A sorting domain-containing protein, partial [Treponema sp.]|nr:T9SS type A sorting domain-containing protein [Treponema sp.]
KLLFSNYTDTVINGRSVSHTHTVRGRLSVSPPGLSDSVRITLNREIDMPSYPPDVPPDALPDPPNNNYFWYFDLEPPADLDINFVEIRYSFSRRKIPVPQDAATGTAWEVRAQPYVQVSGTYPSYTYDHTDPESYHNVNWFVLNSFIYSFTEDSNHNGRIDRIRLQSAFDVTNGYAAFGGFAVDEIHDAAGNYYQVDTTKGYGGYRRVEENVISSSTDLDSIYVYLVEKPYSDGHLSLHWRIARNTSLMDRITGRTLIGNGADAPGGADGGWTTDTVPPRINYALAVPGHNEIFFQMSEPVDVPLLSVVGVDLPGTIASSLRTIGNSGREFIIPLGSTYAVTDLYDGTKTFALTNGSVRDNAAAARNLNDPATGNAYYYLYPVPKYPRSWGYDDVNGGNGSYVFQPYVPVPDVSSPPPSPPPVVLPPNEMIYDTAIYGPNDPHIHRVTDALVSITPSASNSGRYFAWPVWARYYPPANPVPAGGEFWGAKDTDTGIIWDFSGKKALEDRDAEIQVRMNKTLSDAMAGAGDSVDMELRFGITVPLWQRNPPENNSNGKGSGGLWLPGGFTQPYPVGYINLVPEYYGSPSGNWTGPSGYLYNFFISKDTPGYESVSRFDFLLRIRGTPEDLFVVRLDGLPGEVPSDWYRRIRPWSYDVHNVRLQRGGVTILNNVINPTKDEKVYIRYHLVNGGRVTVQVFTLDGNMIKVLFRGSRPQGEWIDVWDGKNNGRRPVARGMYFVRVVGPDIDEIRKIMVVK